MGVETFPILDDVVLPPAKGRAARPRKSDVDPIQKEKRVSLPKSTRFDNVSDGLRGLFSTPSLMKGEDPHVYAELYRRVEEVVQPQDVWDQMMVYDITNHFWEQHRYRRCEETPPGALDRSPCRARRAPAATRGDTGFRSRVTAHLPWQRTSGSSRFNLSGTPHLEPKSTWQERRRKPNWNSPESAVRNSYSLRF